MRRYRGAPASEGIAVGPTWVYRPVASTVDHHLVADPDAEWDRLQRALERTRAELARLEERTRVTLSPKEAEIFAAHQQWTQDEELLDTLRKLIREQRLNAQAAVYDGFEHYAQTLEKLDDDYFKARAQDVRDVRQRVERALLGRDADAFQLAEPAIIVAEDLTPSDTMQFERKMILGLCTVRGGPTAHTVILARGLGVPAVVSAPLALDEIADGTMTILDGGTGDVIVGPTLAELDRARDRQARWRATRTAQMASADEPAVTRDGHRVEVVANIGNAADAVAALKQGAEGVGLFRTEFLFLERDAMPSEQEQASAYHAVFAAMGTRPVVVRTLDVGGDKGVGYLGGRPEPNPFLGWRGIRMIRERPDVLRSQLRALLIAVGATGTDLRIMLPMVSSLEEIRRVREILEEARSGLEREGQTPPDKIQFGIMVEVPSAAVLADVLAPHVDFFSIGTNDLTQYTLAVDRTNERVAVLASPYHPAVLRLIQSTIRAAHQCGKWVGLCGELAGDVLAVPLLLGMGLDEFSMAAGSIPAVKHAIRQWTLADADQVASQAAQLPTAIEVIEYLKAQAR